MAVTHLLPRLDTMEATSIRRELIDQGTRAAFSSETFDRILDAPRIYPATGGIRVTRAQLLEFREDVVRNVAAIGREADFGTAFDLAIGRRVADLGTESRGEMGVATVWDFLALVLLPDLVTRRISDTDGRIRDGRGPRSRLTGGDRRHVLQRLWKRWVVFGPEIVESRILTEDDYVALLERRLTLEHGVVARRVVASIASSGYNGSTRREYTRIFMRHLVQMSGIVDVSEHDHEHLDAAFAEVHRSTIAVLA